MNIMILTTPGCTGCKQVEKMLDQLNVAYTIVDITKKPEILQKYPIMHAPGIVIGGKLEFSGVPRLEDLKKKVNK